MSASSDPSIITLVNPCRIAERQVASSLPWSWCMQSGISGNISASASIIFASITSPA